MATLSIKVIILSRKYEDFPTRQELQLLVCDQRHIYIANETNGISVAISSGLAYF